MDENLIKSIMTVEINKNEKQVHEFNDSYFLGGSELVCNFC